MWRNRFVHRIQFGEILLLTLTQLFFWLLLGAASLEPARSRRFALVGLVAFAIGAGAFAVNPGPMPAHALALQSADAGLPPSYIAVNGGLLLLGVALVLASAAQGFRAAPLAGAVGLLLLVSGAGVTFWSVAPLVRLAGAWHVLAAAAAIGGIGLLVALVVRVARVGRAVRWLDREVLAPAGPLTPWPPPREGPVAALAAGAAGSAAAVFGRHTAFVFAGATLAAAGAAYYWWHHGRSRVVLLLPVLLGVTLASLYWFMATIAGPVGLSLRALSDVPFSPAAGVLVALPLGLAAWACAGLWPLQGVVPGTLLAPLGAALWLRVGVPAVPEGLSHWQPLLVPLGAIGVWYGAAVGSVPQALAALAFAALASLAPGSPRAAELLLGAAVLSELGAALPRLGPAASRGLSWVVIVAAGWGALVGLEAGLHAQVVYTIVAAAGFALAAWTGLAAPLGAVDSTATSTRGR